MLALTELLTVEEFIRSVEHDRSAAYELHLGELVCSTYPKHQHHRIQRQVRKLLDDAASNAYVVDSEFSFRSLSEFEFRRAVAAVSVERWRAIADAGNLAGAPELVVEVLSPSTRPPKPREYASLCLTMGCLEFWEIDPEAETVKITNPSGQAMMYGRGEQIPLALFGSDSLALDQVFQDK